MFSVTKGSSCHDCLSLVFSIYPCNIDKKMVLTHFNQQQHLFQRSLLMFFPLCHCATNLRVPEKQQQKTVKTIFIQVLTIYYNQLKLFESANTVVTNFLCMKTVFTNASVFSIHFCEMHNDTMYYDCVVGNLKCLLLIIRTN